MATKEELTNENAELRAKIAELEEGQGSLPGLGVRERVVAMVGAQAWDAAVVNAVIESGLTGEAWEDDLSDDERADAVLHVLLRDTTTDDGTDSDRIEMLVKDVTRLEIERNDARNEVVRLKQKIADAGSLHGRVDSLPGVVG
tara:strand:- start:14 stop:442 length:429 start_codon:yes stop_codon:yes gene_type:complete